MDPKLKKIKIRIPAEESGLSPIAETGRNYILILLFFLVPALIFVASLFLFLASPSSRVSYPFELGRFSGTAEVYSHKDKKWVTVTRRSHRQVVLSPRDKIRTQSDSDLDFSIPNVLELRLKASSEVEVMKTKHEEQLKFKLSKGGLLGFTDTQFGNRELEVVTPRLDTEIQDDATFFIQTGKVYSQAGALVGKINVRPAKKSKQKVTVNALETVMVKDDPKAEFKPKRVNYQEWKALSEARDLTTVSVEKAAEQVDLRKKAGSMFKFVFDEGVFFKPNWGFADREFYESPDSKEVILRLDYDVFPQNSFSGMYFKTRDLDLSRVKRISLNVKSDPNKSAPDQFRIELKDELSTVRGYAVKPISKDWTNYNFEIHVVKPTPIGEVVFVFENTRVGALNTSGRVYIKDLIIE